MEENAKPAASQDIQNEIAAAEAELKAAQEKLDALRAQAEQPEEAAEIPEEAAPQPAWQYGQPQPQQPYQSYDQQSAGYASYQQPYQQTYQQSYYQQSYQQPVGQAPYGAPYAQSYAPQKDHIAAGLLAIFLGWLGIHKFYLGYNTQGFIMLGISILGPLLTFFVPLATGVIAVIAIIEGIIYFTKSQPEFEAIYVRNQRPWF